MYKRLIVILAICTFGFRLVHAQDSLNYDALSLNDLLNMKVKVASLKELSAKESPGIITVISRDEIRQSGVRDLMEILEMVPGFDFGVDVQGVVGIGVRGNWAHEGKALLLFDGQVMNEGLYSSLQLGNHYPINSIKQIEIIRGPGSSIYGDYAEYAVINIITEKGEDINGVQAGAEYGISEGGSARTGGYFSTGMKSHGFAFDLKASHINANRSDEIYTDVYGNTADLTGNSHLNNTFINAGLQYKGFSFRGIFDFYHTTQLDEYDMRSSTSIPTAFDSYFFELAHTYEGKIFSVTNKINFKDQTPWKIITDPDEEEHVTFYMQNKRSVYSSLLQWDPNSNINITTGVETYFDHSKNHNDVFQSTGNNELDYYNTAIFGQVLWKNKLATVTAGARQNFNSEFNSSLVPRFGLTRAIGKFHFKALYSLSYRAPGAANINYGMNIKPEITRVAEFEAGYQITDNFYTSINAFDAETTDPIIYYWDPVKETDGYINNDKTGTQGVEAEVKYMSNIISLYVGYSFYTAQNKPALEQYEVPGNDEALLAFPNNKAYLKITTSAKQTIQVGGKIIVSGEKNYISGVDEHGSATYDKTSPSAKINLFMTCNNLINQRFSLNAGVNNITNEREVYIQPYSSFHAPLPGMGREYWVQLNYNWKRK